MRVFLISVRWWSFIGAFRTLLSILAGLNRTVVWIASILPSVSNCSISFPSLWGPSQAYQLQVVSPSLSCSIAFLVLRQGLSTCLFFHFLCRSPECQNPLVGRFFFFCYLSLGLVFRLGLVSLSGSQNPREFCVPHSLLLLLLLLYFSWVFRTSCTWWFSLKFLWLPAPHPSAH